MVWELPLLQSGLGGIAVADGRVVFGDRDSLDFNDVYRCLDAETGDVLWEIQRLGIGELDYGNSPRTTPVIDQGRVYCLGAFGTLLCADLTTGEVLWENELPAVFGFEGELPWGYCGTPLLIEDRLIVNPGAADASLVALNAETGDVLWQTPGAAPSYGSLVVGELGGRQQIVGHDADSLGGWDVETGERLWRVVPSRKGDFNVPTPVIVQGQLLVTTENNGTRMYAFSEGGRIRPEPVAINKRLTPDMSSPVVVGDRVFCVNSFLYCLDRRQGLREAWRIRDPALADYAAVLTDGRHLLVVGRGELLLLKANGDQQIISRQKILPQKVPVFSHVALVGRRLYVRGENALICLQL